MKFDDVIQQRRSIRGYLNIPVPKALIREVLELAMRAPTSMNTQPWNFYVVSGEVLDRIRAGNVERNLAGVPQQLLLAQRRQAFIPRRLGELTDDLAEAVNHPLVGGGQCGELSLGVIREARHC